MEDAEEVNLSKKLPGELLAEGQWRVDVAHFLFVEVRRAGGVVGIGVNKFEVIRHELRVRDVAVRSARRRFRCRGRGFGGPIV